MLKAKEIMTTELITVSPQTEVLQAARLLLKHRINGLLVVDEEGILVGILCQSDLIAQQKKLPIPSSSPFWTGCSLSHRPSRSKNRSAKSPPSPWNRP